MASSSPGKLLSPRYLIELFNLNIENRDLLLIVSSAPNLKNFICKSNLSNESATCLLHLSAVCLGSSGNPSACIELLNILVESPLLGWKGLELLQCDNKFFVQNHTFDCLLNDFIVMLEQLFSRLPNTAVTPQMIGLVDFVSERLSSVDNVFDKKAKYGKLSDLKENIIRTLSERSKKPKRIDDKEDHLLPPDDFRRIPILPRDRDIFKQPEFLRRNKEEGRYLNLDHYLDVQFRLYREDFISPLRSAVKEYVQLKGHNRDGRFRLEEGRLYRNVVITGTSISQEHGEVYVIQLDPQHVERIKWSTSKRLIYGSLICLSFNEFESVIFALIVNSDRDELKSTGSFQAQIFTTQRDRRVPLNQKGTMIESSSAYFESYRHVLEALKNIGNELPFQKYIVDCQKEILPPKYMSSDSNIYNFTPVLGNVTDGSNRWLTNVDNIEEWPSMEDLNLDAAQWEAFHAALTQEFVIIQGPPGTGKTHIGLKIAKMLLYNKFDLNSQRQRKDCMMIVCYSNHALDQFLEGIIKFLPPVDDDMDVGDDDRIVRIGSRCKNPVIEKYTLSNQRHRLLKKSFEKANAYYRRRDEYNIVALVNDLKHRIRRIHFILKTIQTEHIVLNFNTLKCVISDAHRQEFGNTSDSVFFNWLQVSEEYWYKVVEQVYQGKLKINHGNMRRNFQQKRRTAYVDVVTEAEYEYTLRHVDGNDDDFGRSMRTSEIGLDIGRQLENNEQKNIDEKCKVILRMEADKAKRNVRYGEKVSEDSLDIIFNLWELDLEDRWKFYRFWVQQYIQNQKDRLLEAEKLLNALFDEYKNARLLIEKEIMEKASVIAMTTTAAARYFDTLSQIKPIVTIIEEAAEVLEAHIVTALSEQCEHVILIGDHKQLEPKPAVYELAIKYNLSISLFERMINNHLPYYCLQKQHRMRPEIAELVRHIYPVLNDNDNVNTYEDVAGIRQNLYFITHSNPETYNDDGRSYSNHFEAEYARELCQYVLNQGYKASEITVLAAYSGQMYCIRDKMPKSEFEGVKICVLDNYQGEENEIIILSLVRSNAKGEIGFLNKENRICVALSRAKKGLFIIGNMETMTTRSKHWEIIHEKLKTEDTRLLDRQDVSNKSFIGKGLLLYCQNHPEKPDVLASSPQDFLKVPDGGCGIKCEFRLDCGHVCRNKCHAFDKDHKEYKCWTECPKTCPIGHKCQRICHEPNECECPILLDKSLPCGHTDMVQCHVKPTDHPCKTKVERILRRCGHTGSMFCYENILKFKCKMTITDKRTNCGHSYDRKCHEQKFFYEEGHKCTVVVEKTRTCGHEISVSCGTDVNKIECNEIVIKQFECSHTLETVCFRASKLRCKELCDNMCELGHVCGQTCHFPFPCKCTEIVEKIIEGCNHTQKVPCSTEMKSFKCKRMVDKISPVCGHTNVVECHLDPENVPCQEQVTKIVPDCNHEQVMSCGLDVREHKCTAEVKVTIECGHLVEIDCWTTKEDIKHKCQNLVSYKYPTCGHTTDVECNIATAITNADNSENSKEKILIPPCQQLIPIQLTCGHLEMVECSDVDSGVKCSQKCGKMRYCSHECFNQCIDCLGGNFHSSCTEKCAKCQLCGHKCKGYCLECKLCTEKCGYTCEHNRCNSTCFEACKPCKKNCTWQCPHFKCSKLCSEICDRPKCEQPCKRIIKCGHICTGYCGEPCPEACVDCKPGLYPLYANDPNMTIAQTVTIKECGHTFTEECLDGYMRQMKDALNARCPKCQIVIHKHPRYDRLLKCKKRFVEEAKGMISENYGDKGLVFPVFCEDVVGLTRSYMTKFLTYAQISRYNTDGDFKQRLSDATSLAYQIQNVLGRHPPTNIQTTFDLCRQIHKLYVYWVLCLISNQTDILNFIFRTDLILNGEFNSVDATEEKPKSDHQAKGARPKVKSPKNELSGIEIVNCITDMVKGTDYSEDHVDGLLMLLMDQLEKDVHLTNAKTYPRLPERMIGIHETDWKICRRGHVYPSIMKDSVCQLCRKPSSAGTTKVQSTKDGFKPESYQINTSCQSISGNNTSAELSSCALRKEETNDKGHFNVKTSDTRHGSSKIENKPVNSPDAFRHDRAKQPEKYANHRQRGRHRRPRQSNNENRRQEREAKQMSLSDFITTDSVKSRSPVNDVTANRRFTERIHTETPGEVENFPALQKADHGGNGNLELYRTRGDFTITNSVKSRSPVNNATASRSCTDRIHTELPKEAEDFPALQKANNGGNGNLELYRNHGDFTITNSVKSRSPVSDITANRRFTKKIHTETPREADDFPALQKTDKGGNGNLDNFEIYRKKKDVPFLEMRKQQKPKKKKGK